MLQKAAEGQEKPGRSLGERAVADISRYQTDDLGRERNDLLRLVAVLAQLLVNGFGQDLNRLLAIRKRRGRRSDSRAWFRLGRCLAVDWHCLSRGLSH